MTYHHESGRPLLLSLIDQRITQHAYVSYRYAQPPASYDSSYNTVDPQLQPTQDYSQPLQPTGSTAASPLSPAQQLPPVLSDSPETRCTSPLTTSLAPQGYQAETAFAHPAEFAVVNPAMNQSKLAPSECPESCLCLKCCAAIVKNDDVQEHIGKKEIENSSGAHWEQGLRTQGKRRGRHGPKGIPKHTQRNLPNSRVSASASKSSRSSRSSKPKMSARTRRFNDRLDAVNGVVIPSKLLPGTLPNKHISKAHADAHLSMFCPRCKGAFAKRDHVKSHFAACVGHNGNPDGLRWDDGLPAGKSNRTDIEG